MKYCTTEDMRSDFLSKPTQGSVYRGHRAFLLNEKPDGCAEGTDPDTSAHRSVLEGMVRGDDQTKNPEAVNEGYDVDREELDDMNEELNDQKQEDNEEWIKVENKRRKSEQGNGKTANRDRKSEDSDESEMR